MSDLDLLPDDDADLRLAQRLDDGEPVDGSDMLHEVLAPLAARAAAPEMASAERIWAGIEPALRAGPTRATERRPARAPERPARVSARRPTTWVSAAAVVAVTVALAVGVFWKLGPAVQVVAESGNTVATWTGPDGSVVTLRPHSQLTRRDRSGRALTLTGEAFFAVAHDAEHPFTVRTGNGDVTVLGTRFNVSTWSGRTDVFVEQGRVELSSGTDQRILTAGVGASSTRSDVVTLDPNATAETSLDWRRNTLAFQSTPAARVAAELEHHFGIRIDVPEGLRGEPLTGSISLSDQDRALAQFARVLGGRLVRDANGIYRFGP